MVTILRCQKCGFGHEYSGPRLLSNPLIDCEHCGHTVRATPFMLLHPGDAQFKPLPVKIKPPAPVDVPKRTQKDYLRAQTEELWLYQPIPELNDCEAAVFWYYVKRRGSQECWPWKGAVDKSGYGRFHLYGKLYSASRVAWVINNKKDPGRSKVVHSCSNNSCCNPAHLLLSRKRRR